MAALIKELFFDYSKLDAITRIDLQICIERLYNTQQIEYIHIKLLDMYLSGYTILELISLHPDPAQLIVELFFLLEKESGYTDESFIQYGLSIYPKYAKIKEPLRRLALEHGKEL
jgi:hypothetical protein